MLPRIAPIFYCRQNLLVYRAKADYPSFCLEVKRMKVVDDYQTDEPVVPRPFWDTVLRRYEKIRYGRAGRIIGYLAAFMFIALFIFTTIMVVGYYTR